MASKARLFGDDLAVAQVLATQTPAAAKALGRTVRGFDEHVWVEARYAIVRAGTLAKFSQHRDLNAALAGTETQVLAEANPTDRIWGIGLAAGDPDAGRPSRWRGLNLLGFALMDTRDQLAGRSVSERD